MNDCTVCPVLRKRIRTLEDAAEHYLEVIQRTGLERESAHQKMVEALTVTFKEAVLITDDFKPEDRAYWLEQIEKGDTAPRAAGAGAEGVE